MENIKEYGGNSLVISNANFLEELEKMLGKEIPCIEVRGKPADEGKGTQQVDPAQAAREAQWKQMEKMSTEELEQYYENYYRSMATPEYKAQMETQLKSVISALGENHPTVMQMKSMMDIDGDRAKQLAKQMAQQVKQQMQQRKQVQEALDQGTGVVPSMSSFGYISMNNHIIGLCLQNEDIESVPDSIGTLVDLVNLTLTQCHLKTLPDSIGNLSKLQVLQLQQNKIEKLPESIGKLFNLTSLTASWNKIVTLPESIGDLHNLASLDAQTCMLEKLPSSFGRLSNLKNLNMQWNQLEVLPDSLEGLNSLEEMVLSNNELIDLPPSFGKLVSLKHLNLKENKLKKLPDSFCNLLNLKELDCEKNLLEILPLSFGQLVNLERITFESNNLTSIPGSLGNIANLEVLNLRVNKIQAIPPSLCQLSSLKQLDVSFNNLSSVPDCIDNLKSVQWLLLNTNSIEKLPTSISLLNTLHTLWLGNNQLTELPESMVSMNLTTLQLSNNQLTSLPYFLWSMSSLQTLNLDGNPLSPEEKEITLMDAVAILDYCRQRACISVMIVHDEEDIDDYRILELIEFLEGQSEIFGIVPIEIENLSSTDLILFLGTAKSVKSANCVQVIENARLQGINIVPLKGLDLGWEELGGVGLSRELGHEYSPNDFDGFCQDVYAYIQQFKRSHDVFKSKKGINLRGKGEEGELAGFNSFKSEITRIIHSPQLKAFFEANKSTLITMRDQMKNAQVGGDGLFLMQIFSLFSSLKSMYGGGA